MESDEDWTLMCPDACRGLSDCYGEKFNELYISYERKNMGTKTMKARDIWFKMLDSQIETGTPYMLYKDACNKKSNQQNFRIRERKHIASLRSRATSQLFSNAA